MKFIALLLFFMPSVHAGFTDLSFGTGIINEHIDRYQTNVGGDTNTFDHRIFFNTQAKYQLFENFTLIPEAGLLWPGGATDEDYTHKYSYFFNGHVGYSFLEDWMVTAGTGIYLTSIKGDGGSASLPNGDGYTSFPVPNGVSTTRNIIAIVGSQYQFHKEWSAKAQLFAFNVMNSRNRSFSYTLSVQYHLGDYLWK